MNILKRELRKLYGKDQLQTSLALAESELSVVQAQLHNHPDNADLATKECQVSDQLQRIKRDMESSLRQKAKLHWLQFGDDNTKFFHQSLKQRNRINRITSIHINGAEVTHPSLIEEEFYKFYTELFCYENANRRKVNLNIVHHGPILSDVQRDLLNLSFSDDEIKNAMWSIPDDKAPGLDGFNSKFYKAAWPIVGTDIVHAVHQFFETGKMLQIWNILLLLSFPR